MVLATVADPIRKPSTVKSAWARRFSKSSDIPWQNPFSASTSAATGLIVNKQSRIATNANPRKSAVMGSTGIHPSGRSAFETRCAEVLDTTRLSCARFASPAQMRWLVIRWDAKDMDADDGQLEISGRYDPVMGKTAFVHPGVETQMEPWQGLQAPNDNNLSALDVPRHCLKWSHDVLFRKCGRQRIIQAVFLYSTRFALGAEVCKSNIRSSSDVHIAYHGMPRHDDNSALYHSNLRPQCILYLMWRALM